MYDQIVQMKADHEAVQTQSNAVLTQMVTDNGVMKDQLKTSEDQIKLATKQLDQNEEVLVQMRLEQRAWVGVRNPRFIEPKLGKPLEWRMDLFNSGQTPALVGRVEFNMARRHQDVEFDPSTVPLTGVLSLEQSVAPDAATGFPFVTTNNVVDQALLDFISNENAADRIYIFGRILYKDVAGKKRETEFSLVNKAGSLELRFHHVRNRMN